MHPHSSMRGVPTLVGGLVTPSRLETRREWPAADSAEGARSAGPRLSQTDDVQERVLARRRVADEGIQLRRDCHQDRTIRFGPLAGVDLERGELVGVEAQTHEGFERARVLVQPGRKALDVVGRRIRDTVMAGLLASDLVLSPREVE